MGSSSYYPCMHTDIYYHYFSILTTFSATCEFLIGLKVEVEMKEEKAGTWEGDFDLTFGVT